MGGQKVGGVLLVLMFFLMVFGWFGCVMNVFVVSLLGGLVVVLKCSKCTFKSLDKVSGHFFTKQVSLPSYYNPLKRSKPGAHQSTTS